MPQASDWLYPLAYTHRIVFLHLPLPFQLTVDKILLGDKVVLILSRRNGESFVIGKNIKITVLSQRSNQVRIGIDAPRELPVFREEVLERRKAQQDPKDFTAKNPQPESARPMKDLSSA